MGTIDEILNGDVEQEAAPIAEEPKVEEAPVAEPEPGTDGPDRDEKGRFKGVEDGVPPAPDKLPQEEFKALKEERTKRQSLEQQLAELRAEIDRAKNPPAPPPDLWENPEAWQQHFGGQVISQAVQQASLNATLNTSEMLNRKAHADFDDAKAEFLRLAEANPSLREQALADPDPWGKAYQIAKTHQTMQQLGATDIDALKVKLREELMAEMQVRPAAPAIPPTISTENTVAPRTGPAWSGPTPLSDLLR